MEVLDFAGPFEVFSTASRINAHISPASGDLFNVFTIAEDTRPVFARGGLQIVPKYSLYRPPKTINVLIIPGGIVTDELSKAHVVSWIRTASSAAEITASVCTGAFLLAKAGLLESKSATTHREDMEDFQAMFPHIKLMQNTRWVDEGSVVTSAGISAGIDMGLHLTSRLAGPDLAVRTAKQMEFEWTRI